MRAVLGPVIALLVASASFPLAGSSQQVIRIPERVSCGDCSIKVSHVATLPSGFVAGAVDVMPIAVRRDSQRRIWLFTNGKMAQVYGADGRFLREVGRFGGGPGEFRLPLDVVSLPGDSVLVMDGGSGRASVFDVSLRFARQIQLPAPFLGAVLTKWPRAMGGARIANASAAGFPIHVFEFAGSDARVISSFGPGNGVLRHGREAFNQQVLARLNGREVAAATLNAYRVHIFSDDGAMKRAFLRQPAWFSDTNRMGIGGPSQPPPPSIVAIQRASDSTLWVAVRVPALNWERAWEGVPKGVREVTSAQLDYAALFRTRLDLINVVSGRLLATTELEGVVAGSLEDHTFAFFRNANGEPRLILERVEVAVKK